MYESGPRNRTGRCLLGRLVGASPIPLVWFRAGLSFSSQAEHPLSRRRKLGWALLLVIAFLVCGQMLSSTRAPLRDVAIEEGSEEGSIGARQGAGSALPIRTTRSAELLQLAGEVRTTDGAPVVDVQVAFRSLAQFEETAEPEPSTIARTDADGHFSLQVEGPGTLSVLEGATPSFHLVDTSRLDLLFEREASCALDVTVVDSEGRPRSGYRFAFSYSQSTGSSAVVSMHTSGPYESDVDGRARLAHAPCGELQFTSAASSQEALSPTLVDTLLDQSVTLQLGTSVSVEGVVVDPEGAPIAEAGLWVRWGGSHVDMATDGAGRFTLEVPPDEEIRFSVFTSDHGSIHQQHRSPAMDDGPWVLELEMFTVRPITALCPEDGPACRREEEPVCAWSVDDPEATVQQSCRIAADGGHYRCLCGPDASEILASQRFASVHVEPGVDVVQLVSLSSPIDGLERVPVHGTARLLTDEKPCTVRFRHALDAPGRVMGTGSCSRQGELRIDLPIGEPLRVEVEQAGRRSVIHTTLEGASRSLPPISLRGTASLTVTVVDADGEFLSSGVVILAPVSETDSGVDQSVMFRSAAGAHFGQLPAGTYNVMGFAGPLVRVGRQVVNLAPGTARELELQQR